MKNIIRKIRRTLRCVAIGVAVGVSAAAFTPQNAQAQIGTYVAPRITTVFNQWVTNTGGAFTYSFIATNWLSPSAWHNCNWYVSQWGTNMVGTNTLTINIYGCPGSGNNYTNAAVGTNYAYTVQPLLSWYQNLSAYTNGLTWTNSPTWTNQTQNTLDGFLWLKGTIAVANTNFCNSVPNGYYLQIDQILTP